MKNPQFMKNINPNFSKNTKIKQLIITTSIKHDINNQSINNNGQFYPIEQNPQILKNTWCEPQSTGFETEQIIMEYLPKKAKIQILIELPT